MNFPSRKRIPLTERKTHADDPDAGLYLDAETVPVLEIVGLPRGPEFVRRSEVVSGIQESGQK
jgi:hypothetical protein